MSQFQQPQPNYPTKPRSHASAMTVAERRTPTAKVYFNNGQQVNPSPRPPHNHFMPSARQFYQNVDQNIRHAQMPDFRRLPRELYQNLDQNILANLPKVNTLVRPSKESEFDPPPKKKTQKKAVATDATKTPKKKRFGYFTYSAGALIWGAFMFATFDPMLEFAIDYNMQLRPNGLTTDAWLRNPIPIYSCWRLFGIKNGERYLEGAKPHLEEHGPFCYDIYRNRTIIEWKDHSVTYNEQFQFSFNHEQSANIDTPIRMVNLPIIASVLAAKNLMETYYVGFLGPIVFNALAGTLRATGEKMVLDITARMLMEGWEVKIIRYINLALAPFRSIGLPLPNFEEGFIGIIGNSFSITGSVGYFTVGPFEAYTKTENGHVVGEVFKFDGETKYSYYKEPCSKTGGSDGIFFPRPLEAKNLYIYIHHLCRRIRLVRGEAHYYNGCKTVPYTLDPQMFNMSLPRNRCYCIKKGYSWQQCDGWFDISPCIFGLPIGLSFPHYYNSPRRQREIIGFKPDRDIHFGTIEMEPQLGVPVSAQIKLGGVITVTPISSVSALAKLPNYPLPVAWVTIFQGADTALLASALFVGSNGIRYGSYGFLLGGLGLSSMLFTMGAWKKAKQQKTQDTQK